MLRAIMVLLDGTPRSEAVLPFAQQLASQSGAEIHLVRVHKPILRVCIGPLCIGTIPTQNTDLDEEWRDEERRLLGSLQQVLGQDDRCRIYTALLDGPARAALVAYCRAAQIDLVVIAERARSFLSPLARLSLGAGLARRGLPVVRLCPCRDEAGAPRVRFSMLMEGPSALVPLLAAAAV